MVQLDKLPEAHTDFIFSVKWEGDVWILVLFVVACVAVFAALLVYRRRRRK